MVSLREDKERGRDCKGMTVCRQPQNHTAVRSTIIPVPESTARGTSNSATGRYKSQKAHGSFLLEQPRVSILYIIVADVVD